MNDKPTAPESGERIARAIARAGLASRREAETWIAAGRVAVNGAVVRSPALNVSARDRVTVDGAPLPAKERTRLFLYHKPRGLLTTRADPQGRPTIFAGLPKNLPRLISVGRLDFNTEGLLLLTNDGALARQLELPATGWLRRYRVRAHCPSDDSSVTQPQLDALRGGITISGIRYGTIEASLDRMQGSNLWLTFAIREGKNHEVRNVLAHLGLVVTRLIRVSFGPFQLGELGESEVDEVPTRILHEQLGGRLATLSGADFSAPIKPERAAPKREGRGSEKRPRGSTSHSWRAPDDAVGKPLRRKFHGSRRSDATPHTPSSGNIRKDVVADRKGRAVTVVRRGDAKPERQAAERPDKRVQPRKRGGRRVSADRASGPRGSRPSRPSRPPRSR
jgi:23S rRNA pseudouridine2605 synthase